MSLPPPDPKLNARLIAERLQWPDGALEACEALEEEFPGWMVFWTWGRLPADPHPGYRAVTENARRRGYAYGVTPEELGAALRDTLSLVARDRRDQE
jgi:hypothetical protein